MSKYNMSYWFEHGGFCVWGKDDHTRNKYGYAIEVNKLPISRALKNQLEGLETEYGTFLDWQDPRRPSPWSKEHKLDFMCRATVAYENLKNELGDDYEIINEAYTSILGD